MGLMTQKRTAATSLLSLFSYLLMACASNQPLLPSGDAPYFNWIQPSTPESSLTGKAYFWPAPSGESIRIKIMLTGAVPEKEYFAYIHEKGGCEDEAQAAGNIFNPKGSFMGIKTKQSGLLAKIKSTADGTAEFEGQFNKFSLAGIKNSIAGKSLVISEDKAALIRAGCTIIPVPKREGKSAD